MPSAPWPDLDIPTLADTAATLQRFLQIAGKIRLAQSPWLNHSWHVTFQVSARGLFSGLIPHGGEAFDLEFDLIASRLVLRTSTDHERHIDLAGVSVAEVHAALKAAMRQLGVYVRFDGAPNELPDAIPFAQDTAERIYDPEAALALWQALVRIDAVLKTFRTGFLGKASPVHVFWGGFDIAVTRFSGRQAPPHPGGIQHLPDAVTREAYSHEVSSAGFWPGDADHGPSFYAYAYPTPPGFAAADVTPAAAYFDTGLGEFILPYAAVRAAASPEATLLGFLETT
jgi:hypothetical protein